MIRTRTAKSTRPASECHGEKQGENEKKSCTLSALESLEISNLEVSGCELGKDQKIFTTIVHVPCSSLCDPQLTCLSPDGHISRRVSQLNPVVLDFGTSPSTGPSDSAILPVSESSLASPPIEFLPDSYEAVQHPTITTMPINNPSDDPEDGSSYLHAATAVPRPAAQAAAAFVPAWRRSFRQQVAQVRERKDVAADRPGEWPAPAASATRADTNPKPAARGATVAPAAWRAMRLGVAANARILLRAGRQRIRPVRPGPSIPTTTTLLVGEGTAGRHRTKAAAAAAAAARRFRRRGRRPRRRLVCACRPCVCVCV